MPTIERKALVDKAEALLSTIRSSVLVHAQEGVQPRHLSSPLESARQLNACASKLDDETVATAADALEAWLMLLATEIDEISHTRTRSLLDQVSEVEVALIAFKTRTFGTVDNVADFVDESFDILQINKNWEPVPDTASPIEFEIDAEMLEVFREEAESLLENIQRNLDLLRDQPEDRTALWEIKRNAHTFKGAAGIVGLKTSSELAHRVEDLLGQISQKDTESDAEILGLLRNAAECLKALSNGEESAQLNERVQSLYQQFADTLDKISHAPSVPRDGTAAGSEQIAESRDSVVIEKPTRNTSIVRISLDRLDELVGNIRELVISRSAFEQHIVQMHHQLEESFNNTLRLKSASGKIEGFDAFPRFSTSDTIDEPSADFRQHAYELSETARDASVIDSGFGIVKDNFESLYNRQHILIRELQERLTRLRKVEFGTITTRLQRTVRVTCDEEMKNAELAIENPSLEVDTQLIDTLIEPLMHLLKNAVVHGIESAETRRLLAKPEMGKITVSASQDGPYLLLAVSDDGRGIAFETLVEKAVASKLISSEDAVAMTTRQRHELLFLPGLTTAEKLNLNAGRGVGMSIVRESLAAAGGTISIETWPQKGTTFSIRIPFPFADKEVCEAIYEPPIDMISYAGLSVLIVDDSPSVRLMMSRMIQKQGWCAHVAKDGIEALQKLAEMGEPPHVILSDIEMPRMGGYEFIAALRDDEMLKNIPVVFISSRAGDKNRDQALSAGAAEYVTKPYDEDGLVSLIDQLALTGRLVPDQ